MNVNRMEYAKSSLSEHELKADPFSQFSLWWQDAINAQEAMVDAVHLATVDAQNRPDARIVLLKYFDGYGFIFFTNYTSKKGQQLAHNPHAAMTILWPNLQRQIRIRGRIEKTSRTQSEDYFKQRPKDAQIAAHASPQSSPISRVDLDNAVKKYQHQFLQEVPCPDHWGGFRLIPDYFEFWQGRTHRLHDRFCFSLVDHQWIVTRLAP